MRTEAFVYGAAAGVVVFGWMLWSTRDWRRVIERGLAAVAGIVVAFVANAALEMVVLGSSLRASRTAGVAGGTGDLVGKRASQAFLTTFGINLEHSRDVLDALCVVAFIVIAAIGVSRKWRGTWSRRAGCSRCRSSCDWRTGPRSFPAS